MPSDSKVGLLAGLLAVLLVAVVYYRRDDNLPGTNIPGQVSAEQQKWPPAPPKKQPRPNPYGYTEALDPSAGSDSDPVIHLPKPAPREKEVLIR